MSAELESADPDEVDKEPVMAIGECPNCGPRTLATVRVEDATYISSCAQCEYEKRVPLVVGEDGEPKVDAQNSEESGLDEAAQKEELSEE